ncbi:MAG: ABC transporter substrate-binding protein [Chthoniobacterales bacterium]
MKNIVLLPFVVSVLLAAALNAATEDAENALRQSMDEVLAITEKSSGGAELAEELAPVLDRCVSFEAMTRRAVGPGWRQFTSAQQAEATRLFSKLIIRTYSAKFTPGQQPDTQYLKASSPGEGKVEIPTTVLYKGSRYAITYRLENLGKWLVTDILAEGVSLVANYRAQFDSLFKKGGAPAVVDSLKQSVSRSS